MNIKSHILKAIKRQYDIKSIRVIDDIIYPITDINNNRFHGLDLGHIGDYRCVENDAGNTLVYDRFRCIGTNYGTVTD